MRNWLFSKFGEITGWPPYIINDYRPYLTSINYQIHVGAFQAKKEFCKQLYHNNIGSDFLSRKRDIALQIINHVPFKKNVN